MSPELARHYAVKSIKRGTGRQSTAHPHSATNGGRSDWLDQATAAVKSGLVGGKTPPLPEVDHQANDVCVLVAVASCNLQANGALFACST